MCLSVKNSVSISIRKSISSVRHYLAAFFDQQIPGSPNPKEGKTSEKDSLPEFITLLRRRSLKMLSPDKARND